MKSITALDLQKFHESYQICHGKRIEKQVAENGLKKFAINRKILRENPAKFNLQLPSYHLYDQHDSGRCWCFSSLNLIEGNIAKNLNIIPRRFALSANYLTFYDKLEKTNYLYNYILETKDSLKKLRKTIFDTTDPIVEGASFTNFTNLVNKYGLVPESVMPETYDTNHSRKLFLPLWREKARTDAFELFKLKSELSETKLSQLKKQKLCEMYAFLAKICGEPPLCFTFKYTDKNGHHAILRDYTPARFRDEFLTLKLEAFQLIRCNPMYKFYTTQITEDSYSDNPFHPDIPYFNLPKDVMKHLVISQLASGLPVKIGTRIDIFKHKKINVLDTRLFNYDKLGLKLADYETGYTTKLIQSQHAMLITGAQLDGNRVLRWKVENTHAEHQFFVMNDNFFDAYLTNISIHSDILKQSGIEIKN